MNPITTRIIVSALALAAAGNLPTARGAEPGDTYYVNSLTGSDANAGSFDRPWKSLVKVSRREFVPGDTIHFARGTGYSGCLEIACAGEPGRPITFTSYGEGSAPQFNNPRFDENCGRIIQISGSNVVVETLCLYDTPAPPPDKPPVELRQSAQHKNVPEMGAVFITKEGGHVVIRNCEFSGCLIGIRVRGQHVLIQNNFLHDAAKLTEQWGAIAIVVVGPHNEIAHNRIENYGYYGGNYGMDGAAVELDGEDRSFDAHHIAIHHNISRNTKGGFLEITGRSHDVRVEYNVSDDVDKFVGVVGVKNLRIANNTIIRMRNPDLEPRTFWTFNRQNDDEITLANNIFYLGRGQKVYRSANHPQGFQNTTRRNNLYYSPDGELAAMIGEPLAAEEITGDPQFVNPAAGDYTLKPGSPASKSKLGAHPPDAPIWKAGITP